MQEKTLMCTYLSRKMSKVRWKPDSDYPCSQFLTGSWGEYTNSEINTGEDQGNAVQLWNYIPNIDPTPICTMDHPGDVTDLDFIDANTFLVSSTEGSLKLAKIQNERDESIFNFEGRTTWSGLHKYKNGSPSALTGFARSRNGVVTIGDDGRLNIISLDSLTPVYSIDNADTCALKCVSFVDHKSVITGNSIGSLKVWDLSSKPKPISTLPSYLKLVSINFIERKPSQNHLLYMGSDDGSIIVWDMRNPTTPTELNTSHMESVNELKFHNENPNNFYTCSSLGALWHWNSSPDQHSTLKPKWGGGDILNDNLNVTELVEAVQFPLNSLDVFNDSIITCSDNGAAYILKNENL